MQTELKDKVFSVEEYIQFEEASEVRHEYIDGYLYEMPGASREHHILCQNLSFFFTSAFKNKGYTIFMENMKVKIHNENIYYYPDTIVTNEKQTHENRYIQFEPALFAEVTSEPSRSIGMVDKLIQYQKFPSLKYYLIVEQDRVEIKVISRNVQGNWQSETYNQPDAIVNLPAFEIQLRLKEIYNLQ